MAIRGKSIPQKPATCSALSKLLVLSDSASQQTLATIVLLSMTASADLHVITHERALQGHERVLCASKKLLQVGCETIGVLKPDSLFSKGSLTVIERPACGHR